VGRRRKPVTKRIVAETLARRLELPERDMVRVVDELFGTNGPGGALEIPGLLQQWVRLWLRRG